MNKSRLNKFVFILLRERLTFGDMEAILSEVDQPNEPEMVMEIEVYIQGIVNRITASGLKCYNNMCNTQDDDVRMVVDSGVNVPMCADCRKRNPEAVLL